jgi:ABC-2 type transport system ATP-binding protein
VPGVTAVTVEGNRVRCHVTGSMDPLLKVVAGTTVTRLESREPSLEELFLAFYGSAEPQAA